MILQVLKLLKVWFENLNEWLHTGSFDQISSQLRIVSIVLAEVE